MLLSHGVMSCEIAILAPIAQSAFVRIHFALYISQKISVENSK
jgi:hypothetical protein